MTDNKKIPKDDKVHGEGNYEASRDYDKRTEKFIAEKKAEIPKLAEEAEKAAGNQGIQGSRDRMIQVAKAQGISFAQAVRKPRGLLAGTPQMIADVMEDWFRSGACGASAKPAPFKASERLPPETTVTLIV